MMRQIAKFLLVLLCAATLAAPSCSDCQKAEARKAAACAIDAEGAACMEATAEVEALCAPSPAPPTPTPEPTVTPWPTPTATPTPEPTPCIGAMREYLPQRPAMGVTSEAIRRGILEVGDIGGIPQQPATEALAARLRAKDWCVVTGEGDIFIRAVDGLIEEWHVVASFGGWTNSGNGLYIGVHTDDGSYVPPPQPSPSPVPACGAPDPTSPYWSLVCDKGGSWEVNPHTMGRKDATWNCGIYYTTPEEKPRAHEYCTAIGMGYMGGVPRATCPVRPDGHSERISCERRLHGIPTWITDGTLDVNPDNPSQAGCTGCSLLQVCWHDGSRCSENVL